LDWLAGDIAKPSNLADPTAAALSLADFLRARQEKPTAGAPSSGSLNSRRGVPLVELSDTVADAVELVADEIDASAALDVWEAALCARPAGAAVWLHGDLKADNLIARDGELAGVIDWGLASVGDPSADYATAFSWVSPVAKNGFGDALELKDDDWLRAKGWAFYGAVVALSYYRGGRNEPLCRQSRLTLSRLNLML
jgi:aminoglycoside phosphotransferase (APT) family kinase protein